MPTLTDLNEGDLKYNVDFKDVYATVLKNWLSADADKILGGNYNMLDFV